ncbi:MAG TPA: L,D-transpeptidase [Gemmatimonadaceae bacterium]
MIRRTNRARPTWAIGLIVAAACAPAPSIRIAGGCGTGAPTVTSLATGGAALVESAAPQSVRVQAPSTDLALDINIPAFRLDVYEAGRHTRSYPIAVGMRKYPTPRGSYLIDRLEWHPWWIPPKSDWARKERPTPPGPGNPMGDVKLSFKPLYFVHGTPLEQSLGHAASHGCIRMANADAIELGRLVQRHGVPDDTSGALERFIADSGATHVVMLERPIPISIRYDVAEIQGDSLSVYPDVYRRLSRRAIDSVVAALAAAGVDTTRLGPGKVRAVLRRSSGAPGIVHLDTLRPSAP